jgi:hypothetical protein
MKHKEKSYWWENLAPKDHNGEFTRLSFIFRYSKRNAYKASIPKTPKGTNKSPIEACSIYPQKHAKGSLGRQNFEAMNTQFQGTITENTVAKAQWNA